MYLKGLSGPTQPFVQNENLHIRHLDNVLTNYVEKARQCNNHLDLETVLQLEHFCSSIIEIEKTYADFLAGSNSLFAWGSQPGVFAGKLREAAKFPSHYRTKYMCLQSQINLAKSQLAQALVSTLKKSRQCTDQLVQDAPGIIQIWNQNNRESGISAVECITQLFDRALERPATQQTRSALASLQETIRNENGIADEMGNRNYQEEIYLPLRTIFCGALQDAYQDILLQKRAKQAQSVPLIVPVQPLQQQNPIIAQPQSPEQRNPILAPLQESISNESECMVNLQDFPKPLQTYFVLERGINHEDPNGIANLIQQCDLQNLRNTFQSLQLEGATFTQLPSVCQSYFALSEYKNYGENHGRQCGYYAIHNSTLFAHNPHASLEELTQLLNNRTQFENETFDPCTRVIQERRGANCDTINLFGSEIDALLPGNIQDNVIVMSAGGEAANNEDGIFIEKVERLKREFRSRQRDYLVWVLEANGRDHWVTALVRRNQNNSLEIILADSLGQDRRIDEEVMTSIREIREELSQPYVEPEQHNNQIPLQPPQPQEPVTETGNQNQPQETAQSDLPHDSRQPTIIMGERLVQLQSEVQYATLDTEDINIGMEGPTMTTSESESFCTQEVQNVIEKNEQKNKKMREIYGENPILSNTCIAVDALNDIATIFNKNGESATAADTANLSRWILSNGSKFGQAVGRGLLNLASDVVNDLRRPDLFLIRNAIGVFELTVNLISAISKEEFLSEELLRSAMSGNTHVYDQAAEEYVRESQELSNKIQEQIQLIKNMPWDSKVEVIVHHGGRFIVDIFAVPILKIGLKAGKETFQELAAAAKTFQRALNAEGRAAAAQSVVGPAMEGAHDVAIATKALIEGGEAKVKQATDFIRTNANNLQQEGKTAAKVLQEAIQGTIILENAETTILEKIRQYREHIFQPDHIKKGIMTLGENQETIMHSLHQKIFDINKNGLLKEGQNQIKTIINGIENIEIKCFIKDGKLLSVDAYISNFNRIYGNFIDLGNKL